LIDADHMQEAFAKAILTSLCSRPLFAAMRIAGGRPGQRAKSGSGKWAYRRGFHQAVRGHPVAGGPSRPVDAAQHRGGIDEEFENQSLAI
jgi:hypothetical protein